MSCLYPSRSHISACILVYLIHLYILSYWYPYCSPFCYSWTFYFLVLLVAPLIRVVQYTYRYCAYEGNGFWFFFKPNCLATPRRIHSFVFIPHHHHQVLSLSSRIVLLIDIWYSTAAMDLFLLSPFPFVVDHVVVIVSMRLNIKCYCSGSDSNLVWFRLSGWRSKRRLWSPLSVRGCKGSVLRLC